MLPHSQPSRVAVEEVWPRVDDGRIPIRRVPGDAVVVYADVFSDGSTGVRALLRWRGPSETEWRSVPMQPVGNDRWRAEFVVDGPGEYEYRVEGWVDPFLTWRTLFDRRVDAGAAERVDLAEGAALLRAAARRVRGAEGRHLAAQADRLSALAPSDTADAVLLARDPDVERSLATRPDTPRAARSAETYRVLVDPPAAQHSAWYELFPRSTSPTPGRHGTFRDLRARLRYIADLGFDVVYLPPIHPIGESHRRGPNNRTPAPPGAPGSPWAIGSAAGGHTAVHPELGTLEEFRQTVVEARTLGLEVAMDLAFQCSPDHPWVREHPEWFHRLPDGTIRTAENPPKRYDDIYPLEFGTADWRALWTALMEVVEFWVGQGVRWFRVDNPHTKPFEFWRQLIAEVRAAHPEVMFLAEAFTRPKVMYRLAKVGFTHSYTYFAWRTTRRELVEYFRELTSGEVGEYFRPHLWPNTPDILTRQFQQGDRSVFVHRLVLAGTLSSHYGIYGPVYERLEHRPLVPGQEEYRDSEKYEVRFWPPGDEPPLGAEVRKLNAIRRAHPALTQGRALEFHAVDNDALLAFSRRTDDGSDVILVIANLDPHDVQSGWTDLHLSALGVTEATPFEVEDLWGGERFHWQGPRNFVRLDPATHPVHVLHVLGRSDPPPARTTGAG
jgi:starch synthase (maltosyl-transferring)